MGRADDWSLHEIFKNKNPNVFKIPIYQRGYDWETKHIDDFWEDLIEADLTQGGKTGNHFFGLIYTEEERDAQNAILANFHRVIDGQQRLTTTAIFFLCARDIFYEFSSGTDFYCPDCGCGIPFDEEQRRKLDVLDVNASSDIYDLESLLFRWDKNSVPAGPNTSLCILELSRINDEFFKKFLITKEKPEDKIKKMEQHSKNYSEEKIFDAYELMYKKLMELKTSYPMQQNDGSNMSFFVRLKSMVDSLQTLFELVHITVKDEEEAYEMFNLVNNRGTPLQNADLIKHIIFSKLYKEFNGLTDRNAKLNAFDETWAGIVNAVTEKKEADYKIENFIHHFLVAFHKNETKVKQVLTVTKEIMEQ